MKKHNTKQSIYLEPWKNFASQILERAYSLNPGLITLTSDHIKRVSMCNRVFEKLFSHFSHLNLFFKVFFFSLSLTNLWSLNNMCLRLESVLFVANSCFFSFASDKSVFPEKNLWRSKLWSLSDHVLTFKENRGIRFFRNRSWCLDAASLFKKVQFGFI